MRNTRRFSRDTNVSFPVLLYLQLISKHTFYRPVKLVLYRMTIQCNAAIVGCQLVFRSGMVKPHLKFAICSSPYDEVPLEYVFL